LGHSFSFLYRNERTATGLGHWDTRSLRRGFQFPLSERTNCNSGEYRPAADSSDFQFPLSERTNCNRCWSKRSPNRLPRFQFPLSERTNCNHDGGTPRAVAVHLSVSSIGTNELQPNASVETVISQTSFSFLYRNERTATLPLQIKRWRSQSFSFLYRNERTATKFFRRARFDGFIFQFPLSERTNCNLTRQATLRGIYSLSVSSIGTNELQHESHCRQTKQARPFSFLYRNERTATASQFSQLGSVFVFQFPLSERTNCNRSGSI